MRSKPWLPEAALLDGKLEKSLHSLLMNWSGGWFHKSSDMTVLLSFALNNRETSKSSLFWKTPKGQISFLISEEGRRALFDCMVGPLPPPKKMNAQDNALVDYIIIEAVENLKPQLFQLFGCRENFEKEDPRRGLEELPSNAECVFSILLGQKTPLLHVFVDRALVVAARRSMTSNPEPVQFLNKIDEGLDAQHVAVGARLGGAVLEVRDFMGLAVGDVVVLDRGIEEAVPVTADGHDAGSLSCEIVQTDAGATLRLVDV
ncbi:MAG: FliM/FliN family flagellar motor C-terminal domain-containing protein [Pseudomonadota bacterium]